MISDGALRAAVGRAVAVVQEAPQEMRPALGAAVLSHLLAIGAHSNPPAADATDSGGDAPRGRSLGEIMAGLDASSHPERITAIAAFHFDQDGVGAVTADSVMSAYGSLRLPRPQNLSANIAKAMRRGWLVEGGRQEGRKTWRITQTGMRAVRSWSQGSE